MVSELVPAAVWCHALCHSTARRSRQSDCSWRNDHGIRVEVDDSSPAAASTHESTRATDYRLRDLQKPGGIPWRDYIDDALVDDERAAIVEPDGALLAVDPARIEYDALARDMAEPADGGASAREPVTPAADFDEGRVVGAGWRGSGRRNEHKPDYRDGRKAAHHPHID